MNWKGITTSWQTSAAGVMQFLAIFFGQMYLLADGVETTNPDYNLIVGSFMTMVGLLAARQNNIPSEAVIPLADIAAAETKAMDEQKPTEIA